jgi:hypothetical protein
MSTYCLHLPMCCCNYFRDANNCSYSSHGCKDTFLKGNIEPNPDKFGLVFQSSPNFAEVLEQVKIDMHCNEPNNVIEL